MKKLHFSIDIQAPVERVWDIMLTQDTYREWTAPFNEGGSYFLGSSEEGAKMLFLGPSPDGSGEGGMVSRIAEKRLHEFISIEHVGMIKNGVEDTTSDEVKIWTPAFENYTFLKKGGGTELSIDIDIAEEYEEMFADMWPRALKKLKEMCENKMFSQGSFTPR